MVAQPAGMFVFTGHIFKKVGSEQFAEHFGAYHAGKKANAFIENECNVFSRPLLSHQVLVDRAEEVILLKSADLTREGINKVVFRRFREDPKNLDWHDVNAIYQVKQY